ncbi:MAG: hypothetical protein ABJQ41_00835 [Marinomonas sp.]
MQSMLHGQFGRVAFPNRLKYLGSDNFSSASFLVDRFWLDHKGAETAKKGSENDAVQKDSIFLENFDPISEVLTPC